MDLADDEGHSDAEVTVAVGCPKQPSPPKGFGLHRQLSANRPHSPKFGRQTSDSGYGRQISDGAHSSCGSTRSHTEIAEANDTVISGGLATGHYQERVINVSNAPPVSIKRQDSGAWEVGEGSGGLVK